MKHFDEMVLQANVGHALAHEKAYDIHSICVLHSDQVKEYRKLEKNFGNGNVKTFSSPNTPELNGIAERVNRTLNNEIRTMWIRLHVSSLMLVNTSCI